MKGMEDFVSPLLRYLSPFLHNPSDYGNIGTSKGISEYETLNYFKSNTSFAINPSLHPLLQGEKGRRG